MRLEIGSLTIATGRHRAPTPPPLSPDDLQHLVETSVAKAIPPGARAARDLTDVARPRQTGGPAQGEPPDPGPLPAPVTTDRQPLRFEFPYGYNQTLAPGRGKLTAFALLRQLARVSDITRICIETRKDQLTSMAWDVVPKDRKREKDATLRSQADRARAFFRKPDGRRSFSRWLRHAIEEVLVIDALAIFRQQTRGGDLFGLRIIDGATIVPLLDEQGETPASPAIAYRQIIRGQPVKGGDCSTDQLYYLPRTVTESPYGLSPTEAVLLTINAALNRQVFNLAYYAEGNVPRALMDAPENWTAQQIKDFQLYFDELMTSTQARSRLRVVGKGMAQSMRQFVEPDFATTWDTWLMKVNCAAFAVPPSEIGFIEDVNRANGQMQENVAYRRGVKPLSLFFKELFDDVLAGPLGSLDLEWVWTGGEPEDRKVQADVDAIYLGRGVMSVDDVRARLGKDPIGLGPTIDTPLGPVPVDQLLHSPVDLDPDTSELDTPAGEASREDLEAAAQKDLKHWRTVALKGLRLGQAARPFTSQALPAPVQTAIRVALIKAKTPADIHAAFEPYRAGPVWTEQAITKATGEYRAFTGAARVALARFRSHFTTQFRRQGAALAEHLRAGLEARES